ncbi:hypothetical protein Pmani_003695 [Petrolisthes manimaculis]|uniref:Uncharacterized protein n=1 Tax=Petrolisthes manimaculis TaxID=1843537 RepID=A0AAE1QIC0_9EUCA|nr:hypothetical protein Pmani_003695 [Petrolisthes manimaculis]
MVQQKLCNAHLTVKLAKTTFAQATVTYLGHEAAVAEDNWPWFGLRKDAKGVFVADSGIDVSILTTLSQALNFTLLLLALAHEFKSYTTRSHFAPGFPSEICLHFRSCRSYLHLAHPAKATLLHKPY